MKCFIIFLNLLTFMTYAMCSDKAPEFILQVIEKEIRVDGQSSRILAIEQPDGTSGLLAKKGQDFNVKLVNTLNIPTSIHRHGLILPNNQDGVAFVTHYAIYPGTEYHYRFPLVQSGTYFMHSHYGLQEQKLLSAPLILLDDTS